MVVHSYENDSSEQTSNSMTNAQMEGLVPDQWEPVVLALLAAPLNFLHLEIPEEELMNDAEIALAANQNMQVGFVQLPDSLEMVPGWAAQSAMSNKRPHPNNIRLWGKHFAPTGNANGPQVPGYWNDFFTVAPMDPIKFS
jgi:hypothetical protein